MPDRRTHRGPHPEDARLFQAACRPTLVRAMADLAYLLSRSYRESTALQVVGNHHHLTQRQRMALRRSCCSDEALARRRRTRVGLSRCRGRSICIDGYNLLITIESALAGGVIPIGRDGCFRDLASVHGTYRRVEETRPAIELIARHLAAGGIRRVDWYLDRPVSNSGRLKALLLESVSGGETQWTVELVDRPDPILADASNPVVSSDAWILDRCGRWVNLAAAIVRKHVPNAWIMDMRG